MERAKQAARDFLSTDGKHDTTVDQDVRSAVTEEHVRPHQHENVTTALKKEIHQDHHQTREQPILHKETLPEKHTHNVLPVERRTVEHGNSHEDGQRLKQDAARYKSSTVTEGTTHSKSVAPAMTGETIHHHVHEHIQPVIQKETHAPETVHTTVPVHETHHKPAVHHDTTTLPAKTLQEFTGVGGGDVLKGRETRTIQDYEGCPKPLKEGPGVLSAIHGENVSGNSRTAGENMGGLNASSSGGSYENPSYNTSSRSEGVPAGGAAVAAAQASAERSSKSAGLGGASSHSHHHNTRSRDDTAHMGGLGASSMTNPDGSSAAKMSGRSTGSTGETGHRKSSLMDKLNPKKDADGDGKAGFLD